MTTNIPKSKSTITRLIAATLLWFTAVSLWAQVAVGERVEIAFTGDLHSHIIPFKTLSDNGETTTVGGFGRLAYLIKEERNKNADLFYFDAGDFSMGTMSQTIFQSHSAELTLMTQMGLDAFTLGNHDFDYGDEALCESIKNAKASTASRRAEFPHIVLSNINPSPALSPLGIEESTIIEKGGIKVGVFGITGIDSQRYTGGTDSTYSQDLSETAKRMVRKLKGEGANFIVCISHTGVNLTDPKLSEDEQLAREVEGIDLIISGHTHTPLPHPIISGNTTIAGSGSYGESVGFITFEKVQDGWQMADYRLTPIDAKTPTDPATEKQVASYLGIISNSYFEKFGFHADSIIGCQPHTFPPLGPDYESSLQEDPLSNFLCDSYLYTVSHLTDLDPYVAIVPKGLVRDTIYPGPITAGDMFNIFSLGRGEDGMASYPLCAVWLTGKELKAAAELAVSISPYMSSANLQFAGLGFKASRRRIPLTKVYDAWLEKDGKEYTLDRSKLYLVISDYYSLTMLGEVSKLSHGLIKFTPKNALGNPISDPKQAVLHKANGDEIKTWEALALYTMSFAVGKSGYPEIPSYYATPHSRRQVESKFKFKPLCNKREDLPTRNSN